MKYHLPLNKKAHLAHFGFCFQPLGPVLCVAIDYVQSPVEY